MASEHDRAKAFGREHHVFRLQGRRWLECAKRGARGALFRDVFR
jgi:hypothetical protein